jgi:flagellin-like protein
MQKRRGISPVIATVIIVAVTIAVAIAVAFWMTGIVGLFTSAEKLEIVALYAQPSTSQNNPGWNVTLTVRNTGTTPTSIDMIFINGVPHTQCSGISINQTLPLPVNPGITKTIKLNINKGATCGSGTLVAGGSVEVKLHTTGGKEYPKLTVLP